MGVTSEVLNNDIKDLAKEVSDPSKLLGTNNVTQVNEVCIDSTDTLETILSQDNPSTTQKAFALYPTKQVVEEVVSSPVIPELTKVSQTDQETLTALASNTTVQITDDQSLSKAEKEVIQNFISVTSDQFGMQASFEAIAGNDAEGANVTESGIPTNATEALEAFYTADTAITGVIPDSVPMETFDEMKSLFNDVLKVFNVCPDLDSAFSLGSQVFSLSFLMSSLLKFLNLGGMFDIGAFFSCFPDLLAQLGVEDKIGLFDALAQYGSVDSLITLSASIPTSSLPSADDFSINVVKNVKNVPDSTLSLDTLMSMANVDKTQMLTTSFGDVSRNPQVMEGVTAPIYDATRTVDDEYSNLVEYSLTPYEASLLKNLPSL